MNLNELKRNLLGKKKSLCAILLTGAIALSLVGRGEEKDDLLDGTILDNAFAMKINDEWRIVKTTLLYNHIHFIDIENGLVYGLKDSNISCSFENITFEEMPPVKTIILTREELAKLVNKGLTDADIPNIIERINKEEKENSDTLSK